MATLGDYSTALTMIASGYKNVSSNRDGIEGERNFQGFLMAYLNLTPLYLTVSEAELSHGYCDILLLPDKKNFPAIRHSYIIELKYLKASDSEEEARKQWEEGVEQVCNYAASRNVAVLSQGTEVHLIVMQMKSYKLLRLEDVLH